MCTIFHSSLDEEEPFLHSEKNSELRIRNRYQYLQFPSRFWVFIHLVLIISYTAVYGFLWQRDKACETTSLHLIDNIDITYMPKAYDDFEQSQYAGPPSPSVDEAWHQLLEKTTIRVFPGELQKSNQSSVSLPQGGYMAWLGVFHELHCIKMVRQWVYRQYYHSNLTKADVDEWSIHANHCLDILRSAAMCHADTTLTTFGWANKSKPMLNTRPIDHRCVDWERLMSSISYRVVHREEIADMVNPNM